MPGQLPLFLERLFTQVARKVFAVVIVRVRLEMRQHGRVVAEPLRADATSCYFLKLGRFVLRQGIAFLHHLRPKAQR